MIDIQINKISTSDIFQLQEISKKTFYESFSAGNTEENMSKYLEEEFSIKKLEAELIDINSEFYFASLVDKIIGYIKLNFGPSQTELKENHALEIERIYVIKEFQGKNIGQLLYNKALQIAEHKKLDYVWLGVWEKNSRAINFYKKNGFEEFDKHLFKLGNEEQTDIMMKLKLNK